MNAINISSRTNALRLLRALAAAAAVVLLAVGATSCGVTEPDESAWQDVSNFSWPTTEGTLMRYRTEDRLKDTTTELTEQIRQSDELSSYNGQRMYMLYSDSLDVGLITHFLPLRDTLITHSDPTGARFALVAPLDRGTTWTAAYRQFYVDPQNKIIDSVPSLQGRIVERFSQLKINGHVYQNAVVVQYKPLETGSQEYWIRIFAEDIGAVRTIKYLPTQIDDELTVLKSEDRFTKRTTLVEPPTVN